MSHILTQLFQKFLDGMMCFLCLSKEVASNMKGAVGLISDAAAIQSNVWEHEGAIQTQVSQFTYRGTTDP